MRERNTARKECQERKNKQGLGERERKRERRKERKKKREVGCDEWEIIGQLLQLNLTSCC